MTDLLAGVRDAESIAQACVMATYHRDSKGLMEMLSTVSEKELLQVVLILSFWFSRDIQKQL